MEKYFDNILISFIKFVKKYLHRNKVMVQWNKITEIAQIKIVRKILSKWIKTVKQRKNKNRKKEKKQRRRSKMIENTEKVRSKTQQTLEAVHTHTHTHTHTHIYFLQNHYWTMWQINI